MGQADVGVGVDMVSVHELADMIEASGSSFIDACWTPVEQTYCAGSVRRLAARWAAKEATMKALGHGIGEVDPLDIEVVSIEGEMPTLRLYGSASAHAHNLHISHFALSLTYEGDFALAFVVALSARLGSDKRCGLTGAVMNAVTANNPRVTNHVVSITQEKGRCTDDE